MYIVDIIGKGEENPMSNNRKHSNLFCNVLTVVIMLVFIAAHYYITLPVINIHSVGFWFTIIFYIIVFILVSSVVRAVNTGNQFGKMFSVSGKNGHVRWSVEGKKAGAELKGLHIASKVGWITVGICLLIVIIGALASAPIFRASTYASLIEVTEADFETDMPQTNEVTDIALMDTDSAIVIGNRALGNLSEVVSQYEISEQYTQINYQGTPQKVANLEYNGFFKWINNKSDGVPGYVMVDPIKNVAKYVELGNSLKYVPSAYFNENLYRKLRFSYPTKIFDSCYFEIDEEGNPYYIVSCLGSNAGLFGAMDVNEVILFNPCDGSSKLYQVGEVPQWVDIVYTGDLASKKYNWQGTLSGGYFNSLIGQKGCKQTTDDYGYLMLDDDVWYYTGVTSVISDESNIGFILTNARTGEYKYYPIVGAEEYSAMSAAEGEVQEKGYTASFPCLINVANQATYILVLKDNNGLVKLYALVNVENYSFVATGETQSEAIAAYKRLLINNHIIPENTEVINETPGEDEENYIDVDVAVKEVRFAVVNGSTFIYLISDNGELYKAEVSEDETVMLIEAGEEYSLTVGEADAKGVYTFYSWGYPLTNE